MKQSLSWEAVNFAASQEIPRIYGTRKFLTVPTSARHPSLSWANSIQSPLPHPTSWRSILILSSHLRFGLPNSLFPSGFPTNTLCTPLSSPIRATCLAHLIRFDFTTRTILGKKYRSFSSSLCSFLHSSIMYYYLNVQFRGQRVNIYGHLESYMVNASLRRIYLHYQKL